jgi:prevent-host-death family protein
VSSAENTICQNVRYDVLFEKNMRCPMPTLSATEARTKLYRLIDETSLTHEPIVITGKRGNAVLISEDDWRAIQETMFLLNIPGMRESIQEGLATPIEECKEEIEW